MDAIVIVGAGHVGGRTAQALRAAGVPGPVVLIGDEPDPPYERPPLSKGLLLGEPFGATLAPPPGEPGSGIEWLAGNPVVEIDRAAGCVRLADGRQIAYRALLLATGGRARALGIPGANDPAVRTLRTLADARALAPRLGAGQRVAIVGGGFIGLEVAASARARGCAVTVLEAAPRLLGRAVPASIAARIEALHRRHGVAFAIGVPPLAIVRGADGLQLQLADGRAIAADTIVVGIGIEPNTALAERAGLACANGIVVDAGLRTADPRIYAAGDVALFPGPSGGLPVRLESWHNAEEHARVAAANLGGGDERVGAMPWFWSDQYDHQLQIAGRPAAGAPGAIRALGADAVIEAHFDGDGRLAGLAGFGPVSALAKEFKLARMLLERGARPAPAAFADPAVKLRSLA